MAPMEPSASGHAELPRLTARLTDPAHAVSVARLGGAKAIRTSLLADCGPDDGACLARVDATFRFRAAYGLDDVTLEDGCGAMSMHAPVGEHPPVARLRLQCLEQLAEVSAVRACYVYLELGSRLRLKYGTTLIRKLDMRGVDMLKFVQRTSLITGLITTATDHSYPPPGGTHVRALNCPRPLALVLIAAIKLLPKRVRDRSRLEFSEGE